ncbi:MAG: Spo0E family sporulation regulatory protein-aspartic acid phosphatase [Lachnospiraceae bacterium]|nr:Spo0E family sporulation regulatory protein-aspartic acid phosphatase [Lachnospiraceae bacterium]
MKQRELLKEQIEKERRILDGCIEQGASQEETYRQSLALDRLIEEYLDL